MARTYRASATSVILRVRLRHATTGQGLTGLTYQSSGLVISALCDNVAPASGGRYRVADGNVEDITTLGTWAAPTAGKCRFKEVDATYHPGLYEIHLADSLFSVSSARQLAVSWSGATNLLEDGVDVDLGNWDWDLNLGLGAGTAASGRTKRGAYRVLRNKVDTSGGTTMSVYCEDDTTLDWQATLTRDAAGQPITIVNPD